MKNPNSPMPSEAMTDEMSAMPPMPAAEGEVMMSIPKSTFDQLHGIVVQLAEAIDALAVNVEQQAAGAGEMPAPAPATPEGAMEDADLAAFAEEISRGAV
jgi:hypothetical protein